MKIVCFVDNLPPKPDPYEEVREACKLNPDKWAATDLTSTSAILMDRAIKSGRSESFPKSEFLSELRNHRLYLRYIGN